MPPTARNLFLHAGELEFPANADLLASPSFGQDGQPLLHLLHSVSTLNESLLDALQRNSDLEQLNSYFEIAVNHMGRGLSMFDAEQRLVVCNKTYANIYDLPEHLTRRGTAFADILRYHMVRVMGSEVRADVVSSWIKNHIAKLAEGNSLQEIQHLSDGRIIRVTYQPLVKGGWVDIQEDITAKRQSDDRIEWLARHDTLTEIANRFHFRECLVRQFESFDPRLGFALHWIDLDHFKEINDRHGHLVGDGLLRSVANRLRDSLRAGDIVGRLGGDEFAVLQVGVAREELADQLARRVLQKIGQPHDILGHRLHSTASIGVAMAPRHGQNPEELFASADIALYRAKSAGRAVHALYSPASVDAGKAANPLKTELQAAVVRQELVLHYHPIVDLRAGQVASFEALMRWKHPSRGMIPPSEFIPIAEETGLIIEMGNWALSCACKDATSWPAAIKVSVNLSAVQIEGCDLYAVVTGALAATKLEPHRLQLEITETVLVRDETRTQEILRKLHALGVTIALDDFGTCFASLSYLRNFPFKKIKIDRSFVRDLPEHSDCVAIVNSVADLARDLKMISVAEGVETSANLQAVLTAGCDEAQGFYFSPPVPASAIDRVVNQCASRLANTDAEPFELQVSGVDSGATPRKPSTRRKRTAA